MRKRGPAGEGRSRKRKLLPLAAGLLAIAITAAAVQTPDMTAEAAPVDLGTPCSLTVAPSAHQEILDDLQGKEVAIDLYKVAEAEEVSGYDTYGYRLLDPYSANEVLKNYLTQDALSSEEMTNDRWQNMLAQEAAKLVLQGDGKAVSAKTVKAQEKAEGLGAGLYLLVVKGDVKELEPEDAGEADPGQAEGAAKLVTSVRTAKYEYLFAPELVSLPGKEPAADGTVSTANPGDWKYDVTAALKPTRVDRKGSLEIVKTLEDQSMAEEPATFVFRVDAYLDTNGDGTEELVYNNVAGMTFTAAGEEKVTLAEQIPVGARVVVTEVYSGASYEIVGGKEQERELVSADEVISVHFTNRNDDHHRGGHGITNSFGYSKENGWDWSQDPEKPDTETE